MFFRCSICHQFPGPGLAVCFPDELFIQAIKDAGIYDEIWQAFTVKRGHPSSFNSFIVVSLCVAPMQETKAKGDQPAWLRDLNGVDFSGGLCVFMPIDLGQSD
nr:GMP synthase [glutamine-hydrolyzing] [Tanacetum cinerariifolium]